MRWREIRAGDMFLSQDEVGLNDPAAWKDRPYLVLTVKRSGYDVTSITVLAPDGTVSTPWDGNGADEYYADLLVGRAP